MADATDPDALADAACALLRDREDADLEDLQDLLRIPSVSTDPKRADDVRRAVGWVRDRLERAGVEAEVVETDGHPCVLGEHAAGPDLPTLLWYGHVDVQPEDPLDEWTTPPFEPTVRDGKLYARGAIDDKGQVHLHLAALSALVEAADDGRLPVNLEVLLEAEEEVGSPNLGPVLEQHEDRLACDAVIISDTSMVAKDVPTVTTGLRGLCYFEVTLRGTTGDLHSGVHGGVVVNPANTLAALLASFRNDDGTVDIPGFYDDVVPLADAERESLAKVPFDEEAYREMLGAPTLWGEEGYSVLERRGARPTFDVNGLTAGYQGEGAKTVIPATASAKVSMRLVPDQDPGRVAEAFEAAVRDRAPDAVEAEVRPHHHARPWRTEPEGPFVQAAARAARKVWDKDPVFLREGGTIPILSLFEETFGKPIVLFGFGLPDGNIHGPDENLDLDTWRKAREAVARFYVEAGTVGADAGR